MKEGRVWVRGGRGPKENWSKHGCAKRNRIPTRQMSKGWPMTDPEIPEGKEEAWKRGHWEPRAVGGFAGYADQPLGQGLFSYRQFKLQF